LLSIFLTIEDGGDGIEEKALEGVRKAQIILATSYLLGNAPHYARKIHDDFPNETHKRLWSFMYELLYISNREFWEVSERGTNFTYMTPEQKKQLPVFFSWFKNFVSDSAVPFNAVEKKFFLRKQELLNFE
jgi:hypothetical protein